MIRLEHEPVANKIKRYARPLLRVCAALGVLTVGLAPDIFSITPATRAIMVDAQDPAPVAGNQRTRVDNYEVLRAKANSSETELVAVVKPISGTNQIIAKLETNLQTGELELNGIGRTGFLVRDLAISDTDPQTVVAVGSEVAWWGTCKVSWTQDGGKSWKSVPQQSILDRGACLKVEIPNNSSIFISQGDRKTEEYPRWLYWLNPSTGQLTELNICSGCVVNDRGGYIDQILGSFETIASGQFAAYTSADPHGGYKRRLIDSTGVISSVELRPQVGEVQGEPKVYDDPQGIHHVVVFNNNATIPYNGVPDFSVGKMTDDRYSRNGNNLTFLGSTSDLGLPSIYPNGGKADLSLSSVVPDKLTNIIYKATLTHQSDIQTGSDVSSVFFEIAGTHILLPNDGDWLERTGGDTIKIISGDIISRGSNRLLVAGLARYQLVQIGDSMTAKFSDGGMEAKNLTSPAPWKKMRLWLPVSPYTIYLPAGFNRYPSN